MTDPLQCAAWVVTLGAPESATFPELLRTQEDYLGGQIAPWLLHNPPTWLSRCHSFHFMRYIGARHEGHGGITIELRFLGPRELLAQAISDVEDVLGQQQTDGTISSFKSKGINPWSASEAYGGRTVDEPFAQFLASSSRLALEMLQRPQHAFEARNAVVQNWIHCVSLIARGTG